IGTVIIKIFQIFNSIFMRQFLTFLFIMIVAKSYCQMDEGRTIRIPVIFHVIYADASENVSTDSILAEMHNLHDDFLKLNSDTSLVIQYFKNKIGNPNVDFYLADTLLQENGLKGIIRIENKHNKRKLYKISPVINSRQYLNVYIDNIKYRFGYPDGLTRIPYDSMPHQDDAVHLRYLWIGGHYRLLTHEAGHWLGLLHVFEKGCNDGDEIADTNPQRRATDSHCDYCPPDVQDQKCTDTLPSNYNNFMDY